MIDHVGEFLSFLRHNGIGAVNPSQIVANDRVERYTVEGDGRGTKHGQYQLKIDGDVAVGWARNYKHDKVIPFRSGTQRQLTPQEREELDRKIKENQARAVQARADQVVAAAHRARDLWNRGLPGTSHRYAAKKGVDLSDVRLHPENKNILVPLVDIEKRLWNLQAINSAGTKRFMKEAKISGCYHPIGRRPLMIAKPFIFCEGWATGKTLWKILGCPVVCCMNAGNIAPVMRAFRFKYKTARFIIASDHDQWTISPEGQKAIEQQKDYWRCCGWAKPGEHLNTKDLPGDHNFWMSARGFGWLSNPGWEKAVKAADRYHAIALRPDIQVRDPGKNTDYNDAEKLLGADKIRTQFEPWLKF